MTELMVELKQYTDQRTPLISPPRSVRLARVGTPGFAAISKAPEDSGSAGKRVAVAGGM
jgi:hypothetical protein